MKITPLEIPEIYVSFALATAKVAQEQGMDRFTLTCRPDFEHRLEGGMLAEGDLKVIYSSTDDRGRPCGNLQIQLESVTKLDVYKTPPSSS